MTEYRYDLAKKQPRQPKALSESFVFALPGTSTFPFPSAEFRFNLEASARKNYHHSVWGIFFGLRRRISRNVFDVI